MNKYMHLVSRRTFYVAVVGVLALTVILPLIASALTLTERSIQLSSASVSATSVYTVNFTAKQDAGAFVIDFCNNTPLIGQSCSAPTDFTAVGAASTETGFTDVTGTTNRVVVAGEINENDEVSVPITGIVNPSEAGFVYARIVTFDTKANAIASTPTVLGANKQDEGSVTLAITPTIGVSGSVLETMTFCVSGAPIEDLCETTTTPVLLLGEETAPSSGIFALQAGTVSQKNLYVQISTNAVSGAIVRLKSTANNCGGLLRAGAPGACNILPAQDGDIDPEANEAKFGVKTTTATDTPSRTGNGTFQPVAGSNYGNDQFALNFTSGANPTTGVTSTFGDPFLDTNNAPVSNKNMRLIFGATVADNTPAGTYSTDLSLIATGKF